MKCDGCERLLCLAIIVPHFPLFFMSSRFVGVRISWCTNFGEPKIPLIF